jgi:hypothetical protein
LEGVKIIIMVGLDGRRAPSQVDVVCAELGPAGSLAADVLPAQHFGGSSGLIGVQINNAMCIYGWMIRLSLLGIEDNDAGLNRI